MNHDSSVGSAGGSPFPPTHWSIVLGSASSDPQQARAALERLCVLYRGPIVKWFRRYTPNPQDAEDLAHDFVARLLEKDMLSGLDQSKGKFRSFLAVCMRHFLRDAWAKANTQKRGSGTRILPLDEAVDHAAENESDSGLDIDLALTIHEGVMRKLVPPPELKPYLFRKDSATRWEDVAAQLQTTAVALRQRVRRIRQSHWEGFAREAADLVCPGAEADETQYLYELLWRNLPPEAQA